MQETHALLTGLAEQAKQLTAISGSERKEEQAGDRGRRSRRVADPSSWERIKRPVQRKSRLLYFSGERARATTGRDFEGARGKARERERERVSERKQARFKHCKTFRLV